MVPQNSHGQPPRSFSPEVEEQLVLALGAVTDGKLGEPGPDLLRAVEAAGREAKERALHPEELILAFKQLERRLDFASFDDSVRASFRTRLIRALLESYYAGR
jgi:hypothetical protein